MIELIASANKDTSSSEREQFDSRLPGSVIDIKLLSLVSPITAEQLRRIADIALSVANTYRYYNEREQVQLPQKQQEYTVRLINQLCLSLRPYAGKWIWSPDEYEQTKVEWKLQQEYKKTAIELLRALLEAYRCLYPQLDGIEPAFVLESIAPYILPDDPWCSLEANSLANSFIESYGEALRLEESEKRILEDTLRPIFQSAKHRNLSSIGRSSTSREGELLRGFDIDVEQPWTTLRPDAASLLHFVLSHATESFIANNWPLLAPSILAIIDDTDITYKTRGCSILYLLLCRCNTDLLRATGIGPILWDTSMACLTFLPLASSAVSVTQSQKLLATAYSNLFLLADILAKDTGSRTVSIKSTSALKLPDSPESRNKRAKYLSTILIAGVYRGLEVCGEQVAIAVLLIETIATIARSMGILFVQHLQKTIKILVDYLSDPFGYVYPPLLLTTVDTLGTIMAETFPRIIIYRFAILKGLTTCWKHICNVTSTDDLVLLKTKLRETSSRLRTLTEKELGEEEYKHIVTELVKTNPQLETLFG